MNDPFTIHWFPLISHDVEQLDLPCHQFVFWTHLRLRQWRCSRLCWCPACKEALLSGKWFAHWHCILSWRSPTVFAVWWINPVDRLTCRRCDTLQNNILKQLLCSQPDITWNRFPSTPGEVLIVSENRALYQTNETNACAQCEWPWKIGRTNLTGRVSSAAMLLQTFNSWRDQRVSERVNYWVQSHHPARTS